MEGLEHRLKGRTSLTRKINADRLEDGVSSMTAAQGINDSVRYTMMLDNGNYSESIVRIRRTLQQSGFEITDAKNYWVKGNDYKGVHFIVRDPNGVKFELQFHTVESKRVKDVIHPLYEKKRVLPSSDPQKQKLADEMVKISDAQPTPPKIDLVGDFLVKKMKQVLEWLRVRK